MRRFLARLVNLFRPSAEREMNREMDAHLALMQEDFERRGLSPNEAKLAARRTYGSVELAKEMHRESRTFLWVEQAGKDVVYGVRMLLQNPGFTVVAVLSLAIGIGANTVIFSLLNSTLLRPLDYKEPGRLVAIWTVPKGRPNQLTTANMSSYLAWKEHAKSFEAMGFFFYFESALGREEGGRPAERLQGQFVSSSIFATLGVQPAVGRTFTEEEAAPITYAPLVLISDRLWERRYNRDPNITGKTIELDGVKTTVVGVMRKDFDLLWDEADYWAASGITRQRLESPGPLVDVIARLKPGVRIEQAQAEMDTIAAHLSQEDPAHHDGNGARVEPLQQAFMGGWGNPLFILQGAVVFVLLIGCANVAGLLLARGASRQTEVAVRSAVGAGRGRIVRQLLTESTVLAIAGGLLGVGLAWGGLQLFIGSAPPGFPRLNELTLDTRVLTFTFLVALATGILFGIAPAMQTSRPDLVESLKSATRGVGGGFVRQRFRKALVTMQIALALVLLIGAGLMINSFVRMQGNQLGLDPHGLLSFTFRYPALTVLKPVGRYRGNGLYDVNPSVQLTIERMLERLRQTPGATSVAAASGPPLGGMIGMNFAIEGQPSSEVSGPPPSAQYLAVTPNYFATLKTPILRGRDFTDRDTQAGERVAIISESMAKRYWPGKNPLGQRIMIDYLPNDPPREIVGVVGDTRLSRRQQEVPRLIYVPLAQQGPQWIGPGLGARSGAYFVMRTSSDPMSLVPLARKAVAEIEPSQALSSIQTVEGTLSAQVQYMRLNVLLLGVFGGSAAVLAAVGIYGVMAFSIAQRRREIGIRMALGADRYDVLRLVGRQALAMIALGLAVGLAGSLALTRILATALWNVTPTDPPTFTAVSLFLASIALLASLVPTRQATRVDPTLAIRTE